MLMVTHDVLLAPDELCRWAFLPHRATEVVHAVVDLAKQPNRVRCIETHDTAANGKANGEPLPSSHGSASSNTSVCSSPRLHFCCAYTHRTRRVLSSTPRREAMPSRVAL